MNGIQLPLEYRPFPTLIVCSNELVDVQVPVSVGGEPVVLVGMRDDVDEPASVWIKAPGGSPKGSTWNWIVENNETRDDNARILTSGLSIGVYYREEMIIHVAISDPGERADVISLDLRPLGMAIHGNMQGLKVAGTTLQGNHMQHVHTMIHVD